jgi:hypothetical protein
MSAAIKRRIITDSASEDLWRVADTNDVGELARVLSRASDVNARNQHGMTALMRAAYHGNTEMVRLLLEHGADPNLVRNDRFTALALAAFFGHTETVRLLIEHGAKTEVVTRCGTSAYMWAAARTFPEAAQYLKTRKPSPAPIAVPARAAPAPVAAPVPVAAPAPPAPAPATKSLKDPPEIWDLVHEAPATVSVTATTRIVSSAAYPTCADFETGALPNFMFADTISSGDANGRVQVTNAFPHTGGYAVDLDTDCDNCGGVTQQAAVMLVDLAGQSNVALSFWVFEHFDENNPEDGVFISDDGVE